MKSEAHRKRFHSCHAAITDQWVMTSVLPSARSIAKRVPKSPSSFARFPIRESSASLQILHQVLRGAPWYFDKGAEGRSMAGQFFSGDRKPPADCSFFLCAAAGAEIGRDLKLLVRENPIA